VVAGSLAGGLVLGVGWWLLAPLAQLEKRAAGIFTVARSDETSIAADGWFAVAALVAGIAAALLTAVTLRDSRLGALLGLTVGGVAASLVAWRLGVLLGPPSVAESAAAAAVGDRFDGPLRLSAYGVLLVWPTVSVITFFAAVAGLDPRAERPQQPLPEEARPADVSATER
jgi:hypothetical protein